LPLGQMFILGLQHVLVMYAGAVAVPLIIGGSLGLSKSQVVYLINSDLFSCGIVTLAQCLGLGRFAGIRLPVIMAVTFAAVMPIVAMGHDPNIGLLGIFGATIAAGVITTLLVPFIGRLMPLFPNIVTGIVITSIGISIMRVGISWAAGGAGNPHFGDPKYLTTSLLVLVFIILVTRYAQGFIRNIAVLLGVLFGFGIAWIMGDINFTGLNEASWFSLTRPFAFGIPVFNPVAIITLTIVMLVVFIESMGMFLALGDIVGRPTQSQDIVRGLRVDGLGTVFAGIFNSFPHTSFSQNIGLVSITGVYSRWVCVTSGFILVILGLIPKLAVIVASIPVFVLGGAGIVMFGMVLATGIRILSHSDYTNNRYNLYIVAISLGIGMIPVVSARFFSQMPTALQPVLNSGILLSAVCAVLLNLYFNGYQCPTTSRNSNEEEIRTKEK
ncbi:TPA: nucleobase:cation symporter-2 family protein, partial [Salmonella enterica]